MIPSTNNKYIHRESFKHLYAKKLLLKWLRQQDETQDGCSFGTIAWRSNWGVHEKLPFYETSHPYYFELSKGLVSNPKSKHYKHCELFDPSVDRGKLLFVPDITIFHKGSAAYLIEVVHTSAPGFKKIKAIRNFFDHHKCSCELLIITADHILGQIEKPKELYFDEISIT